MKATKRALLIITLTAFSYFCHAQTTRRDTIIRDSLSIMVMVGDTTSWYQHTKGPIVFVNTPQMDTILASKYKIEIIRQCFCGDYTMQNIVYKIYYNGDGWIFEGNDKVKKIVPEYLSSIFWEYPLDSMKKEIYALYFRFPKKIASSYHEDHNYFLLINGKIVRSFSTNDEINKISDPKIFGNPQIFDPKLMIFKNFDYILQESQYFRVLQK